MADRWGERVRTLTGEVSFIYTKSLQWCKSGKREVSRSRSSEES